MAIRTITVPVKDLAAATALYRTLLGVEAYIDQPYYVGFKTEDGAPEVGLDPHGDVAAGPIVYYHVADINASVATLTAGGATEERSVRDVGGGALTATLRDGDGNLFGLFQAS